LQVGQVADRADRLDLVRAGDDGDPGRVVAAVLELLQSGEQDVLRGTLADVADDATHGWPPSGSRGGGAGRSGTMPPVGGSSSLPTPVPAAPGRTTGGATPGRAGLRRSRRAARTRRRSRPARAPRPSRARAARCPTGARARARAPPAPRSRAR